MDFTLGAQNHSAISEQSGEQAIQNWERNNSAKNKKILSLIPFCPHAVPNPHAFFTPQNFAKIFMQLIFHAKMPWCILGMLTLNASVLFGLLIVWRGLSRPIRGVCDAVSNILLSSLCFVEKFTNALLLCTPDVCSFPTGPVLRACFAQSLASSICKRLGFATKPHSGAYRDAVAV